MFQLTAVSVRTRKVVRSARVTVRKTILLPSSRRHGKHGRSAVSSHLAVIVSTEISKCLTSISLFSGSIGFSKTTKMCVTLTHTKTDIPDVIDSLGYQEVDQSYHATRIQKCKYRYPAFWNQIRPITEQSCDIIADPLTFANGWEFKLVNEYFSLSTDKLSELLLLQHPKSTVTKWNLM